MVRTRIEAFLSVKRIAYIASLQQDEKFVEWQDKLIKDRMSSSETKTKTRLQTTSLFTEVRVRVRVRVRVKVRVRVRVRVKRGMNSTFLPQMLSASWRLNSCPTKKQNKA